MGRRGRALELLLGLALAGLVACKGGAGTIGDGQAEPARDVAPKVLAEAPGLSFRYLDPVTHQAKTALKRDDIPEAARRVVMVYDERLPADALAAGEMVLADVTEARADGTFPARVVSTVGQEAHAAAGAPRDEASAAPTATASAPATGAGSVILFVTNWCPHCKEAEAWFKRRGTPFTRLDVERDAGAHELLLKLFRDNGVPEQYASSVPVIVIDGKVLLGFDEAEVARALQR